MSTRETIRLPGSGMAADVVDVFTGGGGDLTGDLMNTSIWTDGMLAAAGIPVVDVPFVTIGGGIGSFVMVDFLRIAGVHPADIRVLSNIDVPWETYEYLTRVSQIPRGERLRSDSASTPDNIWGFPSYALREAFGERRPTKFLAPLWNVLVEPIFTDYYTPKAGQVFQSLEREAERIGWFRMVNKGAVRMTRKRREGGYFTILTPPPGSAPTKRVAYRSTYVHVAVGYPGLRFLPDLQNYRQQHQDFRRVVNAYEPHEHVYEELQRHPGTVVVRGAGIVASRVLQRLMDDRHNKGSQIQIVHLFRTYVEGSQGDSVFFRRKGGHGWTYQGFNWPKSAWGGQLKERLARADDEERKRLYKLMGGTTTPYRRLWQKQLEEGRREGFYETFIGEVDEVFPADDGRVVTRIKTKHGLLEVAANFIVDATGLEADIREHRLLADVLDHTGAGTNPLGRLDVDGRFELVGTRNQKGRMYASGAPTLGGPYCGVDSFLGLQYAALQICDDVARQGFCKRIGVVRSVSQWWKWARHRKIGDSE